MLYPIRRTSGHCLGTFKTEDTVFSIPNPIVVSLTTTPNFLFSLSLSKRQEDNAQEARGTQTEKDCAGHAQQQEQITDPSSRQRGGHEITNPQLSKENFKEKEKLVMGPDGGLTPGQTG
jgi:hypothetical protein